jgi:hypothetical protein
MTLFRILLAALFAIILIYTGIVGSNHGWNLMPIFVGDIIKMAWAGQFNVDFSCFLTLSATWLMWRHHFTASGIFLGVCGFFGGALFLTGYLLIASFQVDGDVNALLLGKQRAAA